MNSIVYILAAIETQALGAEVIQVKDKIRKFLSDLGWALLIEAVKQ